MREEEILMVGITGATETKAIEMAIMGTIEEIPGNTQVKTIAEEIEDHTQINNDIFFDNFL